MTVQYFSTMSPWKASIGSFSSWVLIPDLIHVTDSNRGIVDIVEAACGAFKCGDSGAVKIVSEVVDKKEYSHANTQKYNQNPYRSFFLS